MSTTTHTHVVKLQAVDETTSLLLAIARTARSVSREIHFLEMAYDLLADAEWRAAVMAMDLGAIMQMAIPGIGIFAALVSILAGSRLVSARAGIMAVGQTSPGQTRTISGSGPIMAHAGEVIGRPSVGLAQTAGAGGGVTVNFYDAQMSTKRDVRETVEDVGTLIYEQYRRYRT